MTQQQGLYYTPPHMGGDELYASLVALRLYHMRERDSFKSANDTRPTPYHKENVDMHNHFLITIEKIIKKLNESVKTDAPRTE